MHPDGAHPIQAASLTKVMHSSAKVYQKGSCIRKRKQNMLELHRPDIDRSVLPNELTDAHTA
eukprot:13506459-Heterocapsa_arctica.AAC.1